MQQETKHTPTISSSQSNTISQQTQPVSILRLITQTYSPSSTTSQIKLAEQKIQYLLQNDKNFLDELFNYLKHEQINSNFKRSCANVIKKYYYHVSQTNQNKNRFIEKVYVLLTAIGGVDIAVKEILGVALQYIFNKDEKAQYKDKWCQHVKVQLFALVQNSQGWTFQTMQVIYGIIIFFIAYFNSQVQPQDQIGFINQILKPLCKAASLCCQFVRDHINQPVPQRSLFKAAQKIFQLLQISTQRILQQQQLIPDQCNQFITSQHLNNIIIQYLYIFSEHQSIISKYPSLNQIKASILSMLYVMLSFNCQINLAILTLIYGTFINGVLYNYEDNDDDDSVQKILVKSIAILDGMLQRKMCYQFFISNKIQIIFALLMYSKSTNQQLSNLIQQPQKFAELAEEYSECYSNSSVIKVRAANLIRTFVNKIDEGLSNLVELCVIFITGSLNPSQTDSQILKLAKQAYSNFPFMQLNPRQKLDISFMILTVLFPALQNRSDAKAVIISIFMTNFNTIFQIKDELVVARLIRLIGYFPNSLYFKHIIELMSTSRVFLLQGLTCFDRITKNKIYLQVFPMMHLVLLNLLQFIQVNDTIFDRLINQNYESILKKNQQLYVQVVQKLLNTFVDKLQDINIKSSKQNVIICMNYLQKMIKMQKTDKKLQILYNVFQKIQNIAINVQILQDNFISIYQTIISKSMIVQQKMHNFVNNFSVPAKLSHYSGYSQYFKLLNKYILKSDTTSHLKSILTNLIQYLGKTQQQNFNFGAVPQIVHSIGHIVIVQNYLYMDLNLQFITFLIKMAIKKQPVRGYLSLNQPWYFFLVLHFLYARAAQIREHLIAEQLYYPFMIALFSIKFTCKIQRKAAVIAIQQLLNYQLDDSSRTQLIKYCINILFAQKQKYQFKRLAQNKFKKNRKLKPDYQDKESQMLQNDQQQSRHQREQQQRMQNQVQKTKDEDYTLFKDFKHPFDKICEFSMFKNKVQAFLQRGMLNLQALPRISQIVQYQWHKNSIRKVLRISKQ